MTKLGLLLLISCSLIITTSAQKKHFPSLEDLFKPLQQGVDLITGSMSSVARFFLQPFYNFEAKYGKTYSSKKEKKERLEIFAENHQIVNDQSKKSGSGFFYAINEFADLMVSEFSKFLGGLKYKPYVKISTTARPTTSTTTTTTPKPASTPKPITTTTTTKPTTSTLASITEKGKPENVDWRRLNCMSPVRYQAKCSASFAFATTAAIEAHICFKTGKHYTLSPQNLIDCTIASPFENSGCDGGALEPTYDYVVNIGINTEADYPYQGTVSKCKFVKEKSIVTIKDYMSIDAGDEDSMEYVLNNIGPITVGIDATHQSFRFYGGGIYYEPQCQSNIESLNHAVLLVGYGVEPNGQRYWLIRNSYGTSWGENGYAKISRNTTNHCGIATYAVYPVI